MFLRGIRMAKCSRCGMDIGSESSCPHCGGEPSRSMLGKGFGKVKKVTGDVLETGVGVTGKVVKETKPVVKSVIAIGKKGAVKAKEETLKVAKELKKE